MTIGDLFAEMDDAFSVLEEPLTVTNYVEGTTEDAYGDATEKQTHSETTVQGSVDRYGVPSPDSRSYGIEEEYDLVIFVPTDTLIGAGGHEDTGGTTIPYPTEVTRDDTGESFTVVHRHNENNGVYRCFGKSEDN